MRFADRGTRAKGAALVAAGIAIFLALELFEETDATSVELLLALVEVAPMLLISAGVFFFLGASGRP